MTEDTAPSSYLEDAEKAEQIAARINTAYEHIQAGDQPAALAECQAILESGDVDTMNAAKTSKLLERLGQETAAKQVRDMILDRLEQEIAARPKDAGILRQAGLVFDYFGLETRADDFLRRALELDPAELGPAFRLTHNLLNKGEPEAAVALWEPVFAVYEEPGKPMLAVAKILGQFGFTDHAVAMLDRAEPLCETNRREFDFISSGIRGERTDLDQHAMAVEVFDSFASSYDAVLERLENNGPVMISRALSEIGLPQDQSRDVFDAGCGTGLCAPYLRPYAKLLSGADISAQMLNLCREKGAYDVLTRTDLSVAATYPDGKFDLVVQADVLVYFGDLRDVFTNVFSCLRPGGWFVFTVEKAGSPEPKVGYRLNASGRHEHTPGFLDEALIGAGFGKPKQIREDTLRLELGRPVSGLAVAAQKPVLAVFS